MSKKTKKGRKVRSKKAVIKVRCASTRAPSRVGPFLGRLLVGTIGTYIWREVADELNRNARRLSTQSDTPGIEPIQQQ